MKLNEKIKLWRFLEPLKNPKTVLGILIVSLVIASIMACLDMHFHHTQ